ncbi:hypothetical protein E2C01_001170 [Portunus trituberculatus]|uniref:Uncharacterized protein n=1 Tax=Portunus trituberculatus TaxID=210409 RepID=A0A5B7CG12_PORTR|nr:hypothetical protein [Portunus trituberculatus]
MRQKEERLRTTKLKDLVRAFSTIDRQLANHFPLATGSDWLAPPLADPCPPLPHRPALRHTCPSLA